MKYFYIECSISYSDKTEEEIYVGVETYSMVLQANSKKIAETQAKLEAKKLFDRDINCNFSNIEITIDQSYQTSEDARAS
jgi:hypothetical protein